MLYICLYAAIDDLSEILQEVTGVASWWYLVGVFLKVPSSELESIKSIYKPHAMEYLTEVLATWLNAGNALNTRSIGGGTEKAKAD